MMNFKSFEWSCWINEWMDWMNSYTHIQPCNPNIRRRSYKNKNKYMYVTECWAGLNNKKREKKRHLDGLCLRILMYMYLCIGTRWVHILLTLYRDLVRQKCGHFSCSTISIVYWRLTYTWKSLAYTLTYVEKKERKKLKYFFAYGQKARLRHK